MTRLEMAQWIVDQEARRDSKGRLRVYHLPRNDGGGTYEIAGINERYHPSTAEKLKRMIEHGEHKAAEEVAVAYIATYTEQVHEWVNDEAVELFLRDCCFNRGPGGAAKILQLAVNVNPDGKVGPVTRAAARALQLRSPVLLLARLRMARERYEEKFVGIRENFAAGLENRWDKAFDMALAIERGGLCAA